MFPESSVADNTFDERLDRGSRHLQGHCGWPGGRGRAQFLIATHSPIILAYPGAVLFSLDGDAIQEIAYQDTRHFVITRDFLNSPERFFKHLFRDAAADDHA